MLETTPISVTNEIENYPSGKSSGNRVSQKNITEKFIEALSELESACDVELIVALFASDCEVGDIAAPTLFRGLEGARRFWTDYRENFKDVCSVFQKEFYSDNKARLEWTTEGKIKNGGKIKYAAVSVLETEDEKITRFYAYFNKQAAGNKSA